MENQPQPLTRFYILPCMLTIGSLFCGFYSIIAAFGGRFYVAAVAIGVAAVFDGLDGRVARMTRSTSSFGMELDSLCDMVSFGLAPALLAYFWALIPYGRYGLLAAFLYVATTSLRLARFNTQSAEKTVPHNDFVGLPCPAAAGMIASSVLFSTYVFKTTDTVQHISLLILIYVLSYLMISTHRYLSFKHVDIPRDKRFFVIVILVLLLIVLAMRPEVTLFVVLFFYILSGLVLALVGRRKKQQDTVQPVIEDEEFPSSDQHN